MAKIAAGAALAVGAAAAFVIAPYLAPAIITNSLLASAVFGIGASGLAMTFGGIEQALRGNQAIDVSTRQPAQPRQVIYGVARVAGTIIFESTTGSHKDYLNSVVVWAGHACQQIAELYVDSKLVHFANGALWGNASGSTFKDDASNNYSFGGLYMEPRLGPTNSWYAGLNANDPAWTPDCLGNGCCHTYIKYTYDVNKYPNGTPNPRATVWGKNTIYDPRTGAAGWSNNAALCIADFLCDPIYGFGFSMQDDIDLDQLIAAANICDEQVPLAAGGTESRYTINGAFDASTAPGDVLASMLDAMGGRLSYVGGKVKIYPAAWIAPTLAFDQSDLVDAVRWAPRRKFRDMVNAIKGTYIAPNYPYSVVGNYYNTNGFDHSGNTQNNFQYEWQPTDFPAYMQDSDHGYAVNQPLLNANGIELWSDLRLQFVTSAATAQRLAKIKLMRNQQQGSGTLAFNLSAYQCQPLDVIQFSFPKLMTNQALEISALRLVNKTDNVSNVVLSVEADVQQTDISVYGWSTSEELTPSGSVSPKRNDPGFVSTPIAPTITDSISTAYVGADGVTHPRLNVAWTLPSDGSTSYWDRIQVQYQLNGWNAWQDAGLVDPTSTSTLVSGVTAGDKYNVRIRAVKPSGAASAWMVAGPHTVSQTYSQINSRGIIPGLIAASANNATIDSVVSGGTATVRVYGVGGVGSGFTLALGSTIQSMPGASITGQAFSTGYTLLWNTVTQGYLLTTGTAPSDDYIFIGQVTTVASGGTGGTSGGGGGGTYTCTARGTKLWSERGEESNEVIKERFDSGEPTYLIGRNGIPERIVSAEWVPVDHYQRIEVEGFRAFGCSDTHTLLPEGSDRHIWCSAIEQGTRVDTIRGFTVMHRERIDKPAEVLKIELAGPSHEYLCADGVWSHNVKPLAAP